MRHLNILPGVLLCALLVTTSVLAQKAGIPDPTQLESVRQSLAEQPLVFIENRGQWHPEARFLARSNGLDLWVTNKGLVYDLYRMDRDPSAATSSRTGHVVQMQFIGAGSDAVATGDQLQSGTYNYFLGTDRSRWATDVRRYGETRIQNLYRGVDAMLYFDDGAPRYDLIVAPGADPSAIKVAYKGAEKVGVNRAGELVLSTKLGDVTQRGLFAYQLVNGRKQQVACSFSVDKAGAVGFTLGGYDRRLPLVIDPIIYSTYVGGSGWDEARAVAVDTTTQFVKVYIAGFTYSNNFPTIFGSYQTVYAGDAGGTGNPPGGDAFVAKIDPSLSRPNQLVWGSFIGSAGNDAATDIALDANSNIYITGVAGSEFPITHPIANVNAQGTFVAKFNEGGSVLLYSTFVADESAGTLPKIALDATRRAYVTGGTTANTLPVTANAFQASNAGGRDAFVAVVKADASALDYGTYLGGNLDDAGTSIAVGQFNEIFLTGQTSSANFPLRASIAYDSTYNGGVDIFVSKLDMEQSGVQQLSYSSYLGGAGDDLSYDLLVDALNGVVVVGSTTSSDFPTRNAHQSTFGGGAGDPSDAFVLRLNLAVVPASQLLYSTYLGGAGADVATAATSVRNGDLYVTGWTGSSRFPLTVNAVDTTFGGDSSDVFIARLRFNGTLLYSSYLGGSGGDKGYGITIGRNRTIFLTGQTSSENFPVSSNAYQQMPGGLNRSDAFLTQMSILELTSPVGGDTLCAGGTSTITWNGPTTGVTYDLYISSDSGHTYNPLAFNLTGNSYSWPILSNFPPGKGYRIKIVTSSQAEFDVSDSNFTINAIPAIIRQPENVTQVAGGTVTFIVEANGIPAPTVQWQFNSGGGWTTMAGETSTILRLQNISASQKGTQYRAVFTNDCGTVVSMPATLDVSALAVMSPNGGEEFCAGTTQTITWLAQSTAGPFDILLSSDGGGVYNSIASSVAGSSYSWTIPANLAGTRFRIQVRIANAQAFDASDSSFTIHAAPSVFRQPASVSAIVGGSAGFQVESSGFPVPSVQWEVNTGSGWTAIEGATTLGLSLSNVQMSQSGARYRAVFTNRCGTATSDEALLTVTPVSSVNRENSVLFGLTVAPNPVAGRGEVRFTLPRSAVVDLTLTDMQGRVVASLIDNSPRGAGDHVVAFDAASLPSGTYMVHIAAGRDRQTMKLTIAQ